MRIGLGGFHQQPFVEFKNSEWRIWTSFNKDVSSGTYLSLHDKGIVDRVTVLDGDVISVDRITQPATKPVVYEHTEMMWEPIDENKS